MVIVRWNVEAVLLVGAVAGGACSGSASSTGSADGGAEGSGGGESSGTASGGTSGSSGGTGTSTSGGSASSASSGSSGATSSGGSGAGGDAGGSSGSGGTACTLVSTCPNGQVCAFAIADGCAAKGQCLPSNLFCRGYAPGCACDGTVISVVCNGLPGGYATKPLAYTGACVQGDAASE